MRIILLSLLVTSASACATSPDDTWSPDGEEEKGLDTRIDGKGDGQGCDITTLATLYDAFGYRVVNPESEYPRYRIGMFWQSNPVLSDGAVADMEMYLLPDNRVIFEYDEGRFVQSSFGLSREVTNKTLVVTGVSVDEEAGTVQFGALAHGEFTQRSTNGFCFAGLILTFDSDVRTAGLTGTTETLWMGSSSGPVTDPDHLDEIASESRREWVTQEIADGTLQVVRM